jgi:hypothetical protein
VLRSFPLRVYGAGLPRRLLPPEDALVVGGVERAGFFRFEGKIAEALTGTHFPWGQDQVIGVHGANRVARVYRVLRVRTSAS